MTAKDEQHQLTVRILGRDYSVACPEGEREALLASAEHLSKRMTAIQRRGRTPGMERIAVMAALNLARELLAAEHRQQHSPMDEHISERLAQLQQRIEATLDSGH